MKLSVCIASYNGENYIKAQLLSILFQLSQDDEIIISDDGSTDATLRIIEDIKDDRIKIVHHTQCGGITHNIENALRHASGDLIFLSDQDDIWLNGKVVEMNKYLATYDLVVSNCKVTNENLNVIYESFFKFRGSGNGVVKNLYKNTYVGCCMAFNRKILEAVLPFPSKIPMHDWWIGLLAELIGSVKFLEVPLILYRRHSSNASDTSGKSSTSLFKAFKWRYLLLIELIIRYLKTKTR